MKSFYCIKKPFALLALVLVAFGAHAQNFSSQSFLNVRSLFLSTNTYGITNLSAVVTNAGMTHSVNVAYTNLSGSVVRSAGTSSFPLFRDIQLWVARDGRPPLTIIPGGGEGTPASSATNTTLSYANLYIELSSINGSNAPIGINIAPVWDGERTPTRTTEDFSFVIPGGVGYTTFTTNLPIWKWPGAASLRVRNITNQWIIGGDTALTNGASIHRMTVNGWRP